jgi:hypothetical protein
VEAAILSHSAQCGSQTSQHATATKCRLGRTADHRRFDDLVVRAKLRVASCELYLTSIYKASLGACRRAMPMACRALPRMPILVYMIVVLYWLLRLLIANTIVVQ